jgi:Spy/CpxP family protein refolding chaperone
MPDHDHNHNHDHEMGRDVQDLHMQVQEVRATGGRGARGRWFRAVRGWHGGCFEVSGRCDGKGPAPEGAKAMKNVKGWMVLVAAATVGVVGLAVGTAAAQQGDEAAAANDDAGGRGAGIGRRLARELGLTEEQVAKALALREEFRTETRDLHEQVRTLMQQIPDLLRKPDLTKDELMAVHDQASELRDQIGEKRIEKVYEFLQQLTPEQREKLGDMAEQRASDFGFGFLGGHRDGRGGRHERTASEL